MLCQSFPFEWVLKTDYVTWADFRYRTFRVCCLVSFVFGWFENKYLEPGGLLQKKCWYKGGKRAIILKFAFSPVANSPNYKLMTVCLVQEMGQWKVSYRHKEKLALTLDKEKQAQKKVVIDCSASKVSTETNPERWALLSSRDLTGKKLLKFETILLLGNNILLIGKCLGFWNPNPYTNF